MKLAFVVHMENRKLVVARQPPPHPIQTRPVLALYFSLGTLKFASSSIWKLLESNNLAARHASARAFASIEFNCRTRHQGMS